MKVRMFQKRFARLVKSGAKRQTIRPVPKRMPKVGDHESWREWSGMPYRSKQNELAQVEVTNVEPIFINDVSIFFDHRCSNGQGGLLAVSEEDDFARKDGFENAQALRTWFKQTHGELPFRGILVEAKDLK